MEAETRKTTPRKTSPPRCAGFQSAQVSSPEFFDEMVAHPPGKSDVGQRRILLRIGWKHGGVADKQIRNLMSLTGEINDRSLGIPPHSGCPNPMIGIDLKT